MSELVKFEGRAPSAQTAVDVFRGRWACDLRPLLGVEGTGPNLLFTHDERPALAAQAFALADFTGLHVLELGPLEAAHTYRLERMNAASITCVEASAEAWLKCLVVKELLGLKRSSFLLGDAVGFLEGEPRQFDVVFCSGILYHMSDPMRLIRAIAAVSDRCFVWTHVYHPDRHPVPFEPSPVEHEGIRVDYWTHRYGPKDTQYWGGIDPTAAWLTKEDMLRAFAACGLSAIDLIEDQADHPNGPAIMFTACRPSAASGQPMTEA